MTQIEIIIKKDDKYYQYCKDQKLNCTNCEVKRDCDMCRIDETVPMFSMCLYFHQFKGCFKQINLTSQND